MSENDSLDAGMPTQSGAPSFLNVICILSYIGKSILALLFIIAGFATSWFLSLFTGATGAAMESWEDLEGYNAAEVQEAAGALDSLASMGTGIIMAIFLFFALLQILALIGASRMHKLKKSGFVMYVVANGLFALLMLLGNPILAIVTIGFIVMYAVNRKHLVH